MHDLLTQGDIDLMQKEIDERFHTLRPKMLDDLKTARAFGDLSENFEYKSAKRAIALNDSRIRYLQEMIASARIISDKSDPDRVGLFDEVTILPEDETEEESWIIVTMIRTDTLNGRISLESPLGKALMGHREGETVTVQISSGASYRVRITKLKKGKDDGSIPINAY